MCVRLYIYIKSQIFITLHHSDSPPPFFLLSVHLLPQSVWHQKELSECLLTKGRNRRTKGREEGSREGRTEAENKRNR